MDEWLASALLMSVKALMSKWKSRYLVTETNEVYRNTNQVFSQPEPPVIQNADERPIVLMASIIIKSGTAQNSAWTVASWRDREISYSNIEASRTRNSLLSNDWAELDSLFPKRLAGAKKQGLPGWTNNVDEYERRR